MVTQLTGDAAMAARHCYINDVVILFDGARRRASRIVRIEQQEFPCGEDCCGIESATVEVTAPMVAKVFGHGAVERLAAQWHPDAKAEEMQPRSWLVSVEGVPLGVIGKGEWTEQGLARMFASACQVEAQP